MSLTTLGMKIFAKMDPEDAHRFAINLLRFGLFPKNKILSKDPILEQDVFGINFSNPIGLAAGFDKNAEAFESILALGCGFVEVGSLTPRPQFGNPKPRAFRLLEDEAAISRHGFNNDGLAKGLRRLAVRKKKLGLVGVNLGINKDSKTPIVDYVDSIIRTSAYGDYITVNISSPNTEGLRELQNANNLDCLLKEIYKVKSSSLNDKKIPPILLKVAPDITKKMIEDIINLALKYKIDGLIVGNTTISRPSSLQGHSKNEAGGLSGKPLFELSTKILAQFYTLSEGRINLIGSGGVDSVETAYAKIKAGASLIQIYTGLMYHGPELFRVIFDGLATALREDGFINIKSAIGVDAHRWH
jgi:dihydroorotate dehydrogenase